MCYHTNAGRSRRGILLCGTGTSPLSHTIDCIEKGKENAIHMMMDKRLINTVSESKKYIAGNVACQWVSLAANITMMMAVTRMLMQLYNGEDAGIVPIAAVIVAAVIVRFVCARLSSKMSYLSSKAVKKTLREKIYEKLLRIGLSYKESVQTSEIVQVAVEGVDQLETYFGAYLPQFFYAMLAPLTLFVVLVRINVLSAVVLLICVPLIPVSIALVQTWAKKLLSKYWGQYTALGDTFLENLQGLTTLKVYSADAYKHERMNEESERFRKITMKVLTMQLNSITIMDFIAYGGAALGMILAISQFNAGKADLAGCLLIILLAADFFLPMRQLGSFFHIAMNGMAASDKIFKLLELPEPGNAGVENAHADEKNAQTGVKKSCGDGDIICHDLHYSYEKDREILHGIDVTLKKDNFTAIVGESGCGKSTLSAVLMGRNKGYTGSVTIGGVEMSEISEDSLMRNITYISHNSFLFKGSVRDNLLMGKPGAKDDELWSALRKVKLEAFLREQQGLDTAVGEAGGNFSGGQRQRLSIARALLHDTPVYIFDEATSNIDVESENDIMELIMELAKTKTIILISHRLANVKNADCIYVLKKGDIAESGTHGQLLARNGEFARLWNAQQSLENFGKEADA